MRVSERMRATRVFRRGGGRGREGEVTNIVVGKGVRIPFGDGLALPRRGVMLATDCLHDGHDTDGRSRRGTGGCSRIGSSSRKTGCCPPYPRLSQGRSARHRQHGHWGLRATHRVNLQAGAGRAVGLARVAIRRRRFGHWHESCGARRCCCCAAAAGWDVPCQLI